MRAISRQRFIKLLRERGYSFKARCKSDRSELYRKSGGTHCVFVPRSDQLAVPYVVSTLAQCRVSDEDIKKFIAGEGT